MPKKQTKGKGKEKNNWLDEYLVIPGAVLTSDNYPMASLRQLLTFCLRYGLKELERDFWNRTFFTDWLKERIKQ